MKTRNPKKQKYGICKICLSNCKLTEDHVPPKGGIDVEEVIIKNYLDSISKEREIKGKHIFISQNGVKFPTICGKCNNENLGKYYDPVLEEMRESGNDGNHQRHIAGR